MKNSENEKKIESFNINKRELEDEKLNIQKQMEKKDAEINDLNTKFNEKISELESFKSDKQVLEEQLVNNLIKKKKQKENSFYFY
jgi:hypothetical protein